MMLPNIHVNFINDNFVLPIDSHTMVYPIIKKSSRKYIYVRIDYAENRRFFKAFKNQYSDTAALRCLEIWALALPP